MNIGTLTAQSQWNDFHIDNLMLGEYCIRFDFAADRGIYAELIVEGGGYPQTPVVFLPDGSVVSFEGRRFGEYSDKKQSFALVVRPTDDCIDVYIDGKLALDSHSGDPVSDGGAEPRCIWADKCVTYRFRYRSDEEGRTITVDNIDAYETDIMPQPDFVYRPLAEKRVPDRTIELTGKSIFESEEPYKKMLAGASAMHLRSGIVYANGRKQRFAPAKEERGDYIISAGAAQLLFGKNFDSDVPLKAAAQKLGKCTTIDTTAVSGGAAVVSDGAFEFPKDGAQMQALNDFLFYERPTPEKILEDFNKTSAGVHPRLILKAADFERIRGEVKTNSYKKLWFNTLLQYCDELMKAPPLKYELRDGFRLMYVADDFENMMVCFALAYQLTGDRKYADSAWKQIEPVANFVDWNQNHHMDVGIMAFGMAVAYDWLYDCWTDEQKKLMEKSIHDNCYYFYNRSYEDNSTTMGGVNARNNHNIINNAGIMAAVVAFGDVYPELSAKLASDAIRSVELMIWHFAPQGAWYEGAHYAVLTMEYVTKMLAAMDAAYGSMYSMETVEGISKAGEFMSYAQSDVSNYNFSDSDFGLIMSPGVFWFCEKFGIKGVKDNIAAQHYGPDKQKKVTDYAPGIWNADTVAHCLMWYSVAEGSGSETLPLDKHYENSGIITLRNSWNAGQVFVGIKAGAVTYDHSHLEAGSFIYDAMGVRWAWELGRDDYNVPGYWIPDLRYDIFRLRSEAHNTILINPDLKPNYNMDGCAAVTEYKSEPQGAKIRIDMSSVLSEHVDKAERGYLFTNNRKTLVVRDEIELKKRSEVYWLMYTAAKAEIDGNCVILTDRKDENKRVRVRVDSTADGELYFEEAKPMPTCPAVGGQAQNEGFYRLVYKVKAEGSLAITAKIEPENEELTDYVKPIADWTL